jgi:hypothetical protein
MATLLKSQRAQLASVFTDILQTIESWKTIDVAISRPGERGSVVLQSTTRVEFRPQGRGSNLGQGDFGEIGKFCQQ